MTNKKCTICKVGISYFRGETHSEGLNFLIPSSKKYCKRCWLNKIREKTDEQLIKELNMASS